ncbi:bifunctional hydroxymethylpyrimidine kinase/phosphomethylpyrimidine kinase [Alphaproteobacteria bacterium]|nr:bifunctional hydroxymethylpyrimidine kinase/phosphomethylpyrimidine kinase [Alphaproteobacteria bacterium]
MKNIVSVQSTVLNDKVGNHAARSILSSRGYKFYEIPTVILTSHKGVKNTIQISDNNLNPWIIFNNVKQTYKLSLNDLTIVGYTPNLKVSKLISKIIKIQNRVILDPVMGDIGIGLYVEKDVANFFKKIMTKVKYISANFFEWSYLNNKDVNNYNIGEIIADLKSFTNRFNSQVLIRSVPKNKKLINILCNKKDIFIIETPYINFKERFHGAGDQSTALYAHYISKKNTTSEILENVTNDIYGILLENKTYTKIEKRKFRAKNLNNL